MLKGLVNMDDNMSNLTFASGTHHDHQLSASSSTRNDLSATNNIINLYSTQHSSANSTTIQSAPPRPPPPPQPLAPPPSKKKRSLPGNPDPDAEVLALSPKTLLATNRFICEICNKGFQRDQNLQLHRRGHNLPWKLKQRSNKEVVRKKVYVCPEPTCVHHDPSRALGDLTGIKKHFFRKHGEKKWKCDKCSKRYAVQSDWKAHSKICGTREYRCDCGTLFSRRDSFITHRAFCDALAQETTSTSNITARAMNSALNNNMNNPLLFPSSSSLSSSSQLVLQSQLDTTQLYGLNSLVKREQQDVHANVVPPWLVSPSAVNLASPPPPLFSNNNNNTTTTTTTLDHSFAQTMSQKPNPSSTTTSIINNNSSTFQQQQPRPSAFASATALLQKAAQMGATMSSNNHNRSSSSSSSSSPFLGSSSTIGANVIMPNAAVSGGQMLTADQYNDMMNSLQTSSFVEAGGGGGGFVEVLPAGNAGGGAGNNYDSESQMMRGVGGNGEGLTRDFLGLRTFPRREFFDMVGLNHHQQHLNPTAYGNHNQKHHHDHDHGQTPWQG